MTTRTKTPAIPNSEGKFDAFARNFVKQVSENPDEYDLSSEKIATLQKQLTEWDTTYAAAEEARDAAKAATVQKDEARAALEESIRSAARRIQADDDVSNAAREKAGLPVHKTTRTPVPPPRTSPVGSVISTDVLEHTLSYSDQGTPDRRARPYGIQGCEIFVSVSDAAPADPDEYAFVTLSTRTPERITFPSADGNRTAHYLLRWVNTKGEYGPWSNPVSATIPAV
ncbi:MAG: hypothetical protein R3C19_04760 [Planctomycetaceae bacterium]